MRRLLLLATAWFAMASDCAFVQPCDDYVSYMCDCHSDDPGFDCQELQTVFAGADPALQDQCAIDLSAQEDQDAADGLVCQAGF